MTVFLYFINVLCAAGQSVLSKEYAINNEDTASFNLNRAFFGGLIFVGYGLFVGLNFHLPTFSYGAIYGVFLSLSMYFGLKALATGPMALTSILVSFSLIIPYLFGVFVLDEKVTVFSVTGMLFLVISIAVLNFRKEGNMSLKWSLYVLFTLLANGFCSLVQKLHQTRFPGDYRNEFMIFSLLFVFLVLVITSVAKRQKIKYSSYGALCGVFNGGANYIVLYLSATENASVLFPVISVTNIIAVWIIGRARYKEKMRLIQVFGLIAGVISVILFNLKR